MIFHGIFSVVNKTLSEVQLSPRTLCDTGYVDCLELEGRNRGTRPSDLM